MRNLNPISNLIVKQTFLLNSALLISEAHMKRMITMLIFFNIVSLSVERERET